MSPFIWLVLIILFLVVEVSTLGLTSIWFAGGAFAGFISNLAGADDIWQIAIFLAISLILLLTIRPLASKNINLNKTNTNIDSLVGEKAKVIEEINNENGTGRVILNGMEWTARSTDKYKVIHIDTMVIIVRVEGVKLIVEE